MEPPLPTSRGITGKTSRNSYALLNLGGEEKGLLDLSSDLRRDRCSFGGVSCKCVSRLVSCHDPLGRVTSVEFEPGGVRLTRQDMHWPGSTLQGLTDVKPKRVVAEELAIIDVALPLKVQRPLPVPFEQTSSDLVVVT